MVYASLSGYRSRSLLSRLTLGMSFLLTACTRREAPATSVTPAPATPAAARSAATAEGAGGWGGAVSADGRVRLLGRGEDAVHEHGGPPAHIGSAAFEIDNERDAPLRVSVDDIEWLVGSGCPPSPEVTALKVKAHPAFAELRGSDQRPSQSLTVPAKSKLQLEVGYAWQEAYMVSCDRFATRVHFNVNGERISAIAEHRVTRRTALKRP